MCLLALCFEQGIDENVTFYWILSWLFLVTTFLARIPYIILPSTEDESLYYTLFE